MDDDHDDSYRLGVALALTILLMIAEIAGGIISGSIALLADALHMAMDTVAIFLGWLVIKIKHRWQSRFLSRTQSLESIAATINALLLVGVCVGIGHHAYERLTNPTAINLPVMVTVATLGLLINWFNLRLVGQHKNHSVNIEAVHTHIHADLKSSILVVVGGLVMIGSGWWQIDACLSLLIIVLIARDAMNLVRKTLPVIFQTVPENLGNLIKSTIIADPCVQGIHSLTIIPLAHDIIKIDCHATILDMSQIEQGRLIVALRDEIQSVLDDFSLRLSLNSSIQIEPEAGLKNIGPHNHIGGKRDG